MDDYGQYVYDQLLEFHKRYNKNQVGISRKNLNILLLPSVLLSGYDFLISKFLQKKYHTFFHISIFGFSAIEIELFSHHFTSPLINTAKKRLELLKKSKSFSTFSVFKSANDIIRLKNLDAPICIVTSNINELADISKLSLMSNIYVFFDGLEKDFLCSDEVEYAKNFIAIRKTYSPYDAASFFINPPKRKISRKITNGEKFVVFNRTYTIGVDTERLDDEEGGEAQLHKIKIDGRIALAKIFTTSNTNKPKKIDILLHAKKHRSLLSASCVLPSCIVKSENGESIGYCMDFIEGTRLDRYIYDLANKDDVTIIEVIKLFLQIALAVRIVHLCDFVIGDLYIYNFMVERGRIRIVDCDSFQVLNYPCDGFHNELVELEGRYLTCQDDFNSLKYMLDEWVGSFGERIRLQYNDVLQTYRSFTNDTSGLIYAFYYYLHSLGEF